MRYFLLTLLLFSTSLFASAPLSSFDPETNIAYINSMVMLNPDGTFKVFDIQLQLLPSGFLAIKAIPNVVVCDGFSPVPAECYGLIPIAK